MKIFATHDRLGTIQHLVIVPANAPLGAVAIPGEHLVSEIDAPDVQADTTSPERLETLIETIRSYRVETAARGKLIRKE